MAANLQSVPGTKQVNRAEIIDQNFTRYVKEFDGEVRKVSGSFPNSNLSAKTFMELFESQLMSRHLDLMARVLRLENKVFYTIGSSGHEGNVLLGRLTRHTDPAFLHYRSGGFMMERSRHLPAIDPVYDAALSFAASASDPSSGGRHKVWGSKALWVLPQTSTIASHLPKAVGTGLAIAQAARMGHELPVPSDSISMVSFGDASLNHSTAQGAINAAQWTAHQQIPLPLIFLCEDNNIGISVKAPNDWVGASMRNRPGLRYVRANGLNLLQAYDQVAAAVEFCRDRRKPVFLHLDVVRLMGHAGTDFEVDYRELQDIEHAESRDPLLCSASIALEHGLATREELIDLYESIRTRCFEAAERADRERKITTLEEVRSPLAPLDMDGIVKEANRADYGEQRLQTFGSEKALPENQAPKHLAVNINRALHDLFAKYPETLLFGEDVARKGGVYTVTRNLLKKFGSTRVFNTLLDEQTILGLAQGYANMGMLPVPEIQYLAYFHNACDQIRGEACSLQFFSNNQYSNPMVMRIASLGYQKGFGGHFHNDNSIAALRDIPGLIIGCPSRGDDAVTMLRTLFAAAKVSGRVCAFLEPIALYMTKDLHQVGDGEWQFDYPGPEQAMALGDPRVYNPFADELLVITYGNGVPMSLQMAKRLERDHGVKACVMDLRWLLPLNEAEIIRQAERCRRVLVVDEGRRSAGISEAIMSLIAEQAAPVPPLARVVGDDCFTPLGSAAGLVLPSTDDVYQAALGLLASA